MFGTFETGKAFYAPISVSRAVAKYDGDYYRAFENSSKLSRKFRYSCIDVVRGIFEKHV